MSKEKILIIEDDLDSALILEDVFNELGFECELKTDPLKALDYIKDNTIDLIVCDYQLPNINGIEFLERSLDVKAQKILITAHGNNEIATRALELGAYDYINKPLNYKELAIISQRAILSQQIISENRDLKDKIKNIRSSKVNFIGRSKQVSEINRLIEQVSDNDASILISGETGTGKEVLAKKIHELSKRKGELITINCASIPENLLESELFGHKKGSFTGAIDDKDGLFLKANKGTLFLDEIGDMPMALQAKMLRVLQERKVRPIGDSKEYEIDIRVISATHKDLDALISEKEFREDLYFRLNIINILLPALKERIEDVELLVDFFLERINQKKQRQLKISNKALSYLMEHTWPGNIRELENVIERSSIVTQNDIIDLKDITIATYKPQGKVDNPFEKLPTSKELEALYIQFLLEKYDGVKEKVAQVLEVNRKTLYRKIKEFELE